MEVLATALRPVDRRSTLSLGRVARFWPFNRSRIVDLAATISSGKVVPDTLESPVVLLLLDR